MEYYKQLHESFEDNVNLLDDYSYKYGWNSVERDVLEPHCNCTGAYEMHGLKISQVVKGDSGHLKTTKAKDGICEFCGHYVKYQTEVVNNRGKHFRSN
jgi:hypothetical protein